MKLSAFIAALTTIQTAHGDLEVIDDFHDDAFPFLVNGDGFLIICGSAPIPYNNEPPA